MPNTPLQQTAINRQVKERLLNAPAISQGYAADSAQGFGRGLEPSFAPRGTTIGLVDDRDHSVRESSHTTGSSHVSRRELGVAPVAPESPIVFVVDDDVSVRESLELLIRKEGWRAKTFISAEEFLDCPRAVAPNCLILDVSLPDLNGLELQKRVATERSEMPIIFITGCGDVPKSVQAMKGGAVEFLTKPFNSEVLVSAIRQALERSRLALAHESEMQELRNRYASLSRRERQVMALVVSGLLNKQVGGELGISEITVKRHRRQAMQKMKADSLADLVKMAGKLRLTEHTARRTA
ncbi:MAG: response regulator transcription factor [Acidobacteriaceae bacterium]|nr:response regulator transcription factor [Acidobacteriaceae bacterium]